MLKNKKGETFIETLVSLLILVIVITGFTTIIATTAKLNKTVKDARTTFNEKSRQTVSDWTVTVKGVGSTVMNPATFSKYDGKMGVVGYTDEGEELYYYENK